MRNYEIVVINHKFAVVEQKTQYVLKRFDNRPNAVKLAKRLNGGFAFNGETPTFFIPKQDRLNE